MDNFIYYEVGGASSQVVFTLDRLHDPIDGAVARKDLA